MKECQVTVPNKLDPEKPFIEESLFCPRCYQTVRITSEMRIIIDSLKNNDGSVTVKSKDILTELGTVPSGATEGGSAATAATFDITPTRPTPRAN